MLTIVAILFFQISKLIAYFKTESFNNKEYMNRKTTKRKVASIFIALVLDIVIFMILMKIGIDQLYVFDRTESLNPWRYR